MRKELLLPGVAVVGGAAGFFVRRWDRAVAFEPDTGLVIPDMPSTWLLLALSAAVVVALIVFGRGRHRAFSGGYDQAYAAKGNTLYITAMVLSAFLVLAAGVLLLLGMGDIVSKQTQMQGVLTGQSLIAMLPRLLLAVLCVASSFCVFSSGKNNYKGEKRGKYSFTLLMPAYLACLWLIVAYQSKAADPVMLDYLYELFAIMATLLGFYFAAGFSFERGKVFCTVLLSLLAVYFSLVTLADVHDLATMLLHGFAILYLLSSTVALLFNDGLPEPPHVRPPVVEEQEEIELEEFIDE